MHKRLDWRFSWLTTWDEVWEPSFVAKWRQWIDNSPDAHVFFEPSIVRAWLRYYQALERIEPRFVIAEHVSGCKVLFPLVYIRYGWKDSWYRILEPPGAGHFDYHDPIFTERCEGEVLSSFWNAFNEEIIGGFGREVDEVIIPRVRESCVGEYQHFTERSRAPFIDLREITDIGTLLANISNKLRRDIQRQVRRLEELGNLQLKVFRKDELSLAMDALYGLINAYCVKWRASEKVGDIWKQMLQECLKEDFFHISVLQSNGIPISWHIGFLHKSRFYHYKLAFDMKLANYSPGKVHRTKLVEESLRRGATVFDFLRGEEEYKYHWTKSSIVLYQLRKEMPGLRSWVTRNTRRILWANRNRVRRLRKRLR
jgi:CelD/BcsL family acetyltransferase involved in cellulose biosynthesis